MMPPKKVPNTIQRIRCMPTFVCPSVATFVEAILSKEAIFATCAMINSSAAVPTFDATLDHAGRQFIVRLTDSAGVKDSSEQRWNLNCSNAGAGAFSKTFLAQAPRVLVSLWDETSSVSEGVESGGYLESSHMKSGGQKPEMDSIVWSIRVRGTVQGVGFRPAVYKLARELGINGHVLNDGDGVIIEAWAPEPVLTDFLQLIKTKAPP